MLYLVAPDGLQWTANVGQEAVDLSKEHGKDLGVLDGWWEPAETRMNADHVRAALRWGVASSLGIVVAGVRTVVLQRPHEMRALQAESVPRMRAYRDSAQVKAVDDYLEQQMPGWKEHGRKTDEGVEASLAWSVEEAEREAERELAKHPVDPALRSHWLLLGGVLPEPE